MRRSLIGLACLFSVACASEDMTSAGDGTDSDEAPACTEGTSTTVRSSFPLMQTFWSDGEQFIAHSDRHLFINDGETTTLLENATPATELRDLDAISVNEAWLVRGRSIEFWDGHTLSPVLLEVYFPFLDVAPDQRVFALAHRPCTVDFCPPRVWERQADGSWDELAVPDLRKTIAFAAGPDGELWIVDEDWRLGHRRDGQWTIEVPEALGWPDTFEPRAIDVDADGHMWAAMDKGPRIDLAHWSPTSGWSLHQDLIVSNSDHLDASTLIADGDAVIVFRPSADQPLRRSVAGAPFVDLVPAEQLGLDPLAALGGNKDRLALLSTQTRVRAIDPKLDPVAVDELAESATLQATPISAATLDATYGVRDDTLFRFDGERWTRALQVPPTDTYDPDSYIADVFADSESSGWLIAGSLDSYGQVYGERLLRWEAEPATLTSFPVPEYTHLQWLWGAGPDRVWLIGDPSGATNMAVWLFDGVEWQLVHEDPVAAGSFTGDAEDLFIARVDGTVLAYEAGEWRELGQAVSAPFQPSGWLGRARRDMIARVGDELLVGDMRWDGQSWVPLTSLPSARWYANDAHGRAWAITSDERVYFHDGVGPADQGWVETDLSAGYFARLSATPDGVVVQDIETTSVFRWSCE